MANPIDSFTSAAAFALTLPGTELGTYYGSPAVKTKENGRSFLVTGHEPGSSFCLILAPDLAQILLETGPDTFWQSPHYRGTNAVLVRYFSNDPQRVCATIEAARAAAAALKPARPRKA